MMARGVGILVGDALVAGTQDAETSTSESSTPQSTQPATTSQQAHPEKTKQGLI